VTPSATAAGGLVAAEPPPGEVAARVTTAEYARLLGLPRARPLEGVVADRARRARAWYAAHGRPNVAARRIAVESIDAGTVVVASGLRLSSRRLASRLAGGAAALMAVAVTAGAEVDAESERLWSAGCPDEAYFLDRFGAVVAETLVRGAMTWTCRLSEPAGETLLPHLSPGCGDWDLADQKTLMGLIAGEGAAALGPLALLESGMLRPKNSLLAAFAVSRGSVPPSPADACADCDLVPCRFRRVPLRPPRAAAGAVGGAL
jgi:hypothetical protein